MNRALALALALLGLAACARCSAPAPAPPAPPPVTIEIPRTRGPIVIDGEAEEETWPNAWRSPPFEDAKGRHSPHTELRLAGDDEKLYVLVYVADEDLRTTARADDPRGTGDRVRLSLGPLTIVLSPGGAALTGGVKAAMDVDGTVDDGDDDDEEWVTEVSVPWTAVGGDQARDEGVLVRAVRLDAPRGERERALAWPREAPAKVVLARKAPR